jgi:ribonuclease P protein component
MKTIKKSEDISNIFKTGKSFSNKYVIFIIEPIQIVEQSHNNYQHDRLGRVAYIAGKKNGNAVWRNSAKRRLRSIYNDLKDSLPNCRILMVAKADILTVEYKKLAEECKNTVSKVNRHFAKTIENNKKDSS